MSKVTDAIFNSRQEANFAFIMNRIHSQNKEMGGVLTESTGMQGSAKTSAMLSFCHHNILKHPDQKNFWRNTYDSPLQFTKLPPGTWEIMVEEGHNLKFYERSEHLPEIPVEYKVFKTLDELHDDATPGKCTAVFFRDESYWMNLVHYLGFRGEWNHVFLDEYGELFPSNPSGPLYRKIMEAVFDFGEIRKRNINVHTTTQVASDVFYGIRRKIMIFIYFPGARAAGGLVKQEAVDKLELNPVKGNQAWLELRGHRYGKGRFTQIYKPISYMDWMARRPDGAIRISDYLKDPYKSRKGGRPRKRRPGDEEFEEEGFTYENY